MGKVKEELLTSEHVLFDISWDLYPNRLLVMDIVIVLLCYRQLSVAVLSWFWQRRGTNSTSRHQT